MAAVDFKLLDQLETADLIALEWQTRWNTIAHPHQRAPSGNWSTWLMLAGRGAGKTRAGAEIISQWAWNSPGTRWLVAAPTKADLRAVCFEGHSGLLNVIPPALIETTVGGGLWNSSLAEITLINGSLIKGLSADEPERFRGPQFHGALLDELCAWSDAEASFEMIEYCLRLGQHPRMLISTTPKPTPFLKSLVARAGKGDVVITQASTYDNAANLAPSFLAKLKEKEGTALGRQEIFAEVLDGELNGIIKRNKFRLWPHGRPLPKLDFILVSLDTAFTEEDFDKKKQTADPTACTIWGVFYHEERKRNCILLLDAWEDHLGFDDLRLRAMAESKEQWGNMDTAHISGRTVKKGRKPDITVVEAKGSGISLCQSMEREGVNIYRYDPGKMSKLTRLHLVSHIFHNGLVYLPESTKNLGKPRNWCDGLLDQLCSYIGPGSTRNDDWVDSTTQAILYLIQCLAITVTEVKDHIKDTYYDDEHPVVQENRENPYAA